MYKNILLLLLVLILFLNCNPGGSRGDGGSGGKNDGKDEGVPSSSSINIEITYTQGTGSFSRSIVYVIWIENQAGNNIQNLYVCERLVGKGNGPLTGTALPYWKTNKYPGSSIDGVTGATEKGNFVLTRNLANFGIRKFKIYMELDRSFDENDWFKDQPALIYSTSEIDLDNLQPQYDFSPVGWSPNENTGNSSNKFKDDPPHSSPAFASLNTDMRYINNRADTSTSPYGIGAVYPTTLAPAVPATCLVGTLTAKITIN